MNIIKSAVRQTTAMLLIIVLCAGVLFTGCKTSQITSEENLNEDKSGEGQSDFSKFTEEMFLSEVVSDTITLHYTISNPSSFGIDDYRVTLGEYGADTYTQTAKDITSYLNELHEFDYDSLTYNEQLTYDILEEYFETELEASELYLYSEVLSPTIGLQAELPTIFAEYMFNTEQDVKDYLELLSQLDEYYEQIIEFEELKSESGTFMPDFAVEAVVSQCESFISGDAEDNYLIKSFNEKISDVEGLSKSDIKSYKSKNKKAVKNHVIPAYELLIDGLNDLKGTGTNEGGLCNYENGAEYYEYLVKSGTGSSRSIEDLQEMLENELNGSLLGFYTLIQNNDNLYDEMYNYTFDLTEPDDIINDLISKISEDFPEPVTTDYRIKYVPESLQDDLSPAFYLTAPIDDLDNNVIYINQNPDYEGQDLYSTLAHEGYPGHLYQTTYFSSTNPDPIRELLNFSGYCEGWATYVELYSYGISGLDEDLAEALQYNTSFALSVYSLIDIGINYYGWTIDDTEEFLNTYYVTDDDMVQDIYECMVEEPANYLLYCVGYLEFENLLSSAQDALGDAFVLKDFHRFLLETGPAQFNIIEKYMDAWIAEQ